MLDFGCFINLENKNPFDDDLSAIGLTFNNDGTIDISDDFTTSVSSNLRDVHDALAGSDRFFTKISDAIDTIHCASESSYVSSFTSVLSYDANGSSHQSIYNENSSSIISFFA